MTLSSRPLNGREFPLSILNTHIYGRFLTKKFCTCGFFKVFSPQQKNTSRLTRQARWLCRSSLKIYIPPSPPFLCHRLFSFLRFHFFCHQAAYVTEQPAPSFPAAQEYTAYCIRHTAAHGILRVSYFTSGFSSCFFNSFSRSSDGASGRCFHGWFLYFVIIDTIFQSRLYSFATAGVGFITPYSTDRHGLSVYGVTYLPSVFIDFPLIQFFLCHILSTVFLFSHCVPCHFRSIHFVTVYYCLCQLRSTCF